MKKTCFLLLFLAIGFIVANGQTKPRVYFVAAKSGISLREKPDLSAKAIDKIPYGEKISTTIAEGANEITVEGFKANWVTVSYKGKTGFIVDAFLFNVVPPKTGTKDLKAYLLQVTQPFSVPLKVSRQGAFEEDMSVVEKQLYKNGAERQLYHFYESGAEICMMPGFSIPQAFQLLRLLPEYKECVGEHDPFPLKNDSLKTDKIDKSVKVYGENIGDNSFFVDRIKMDLTHDIYYGLELFILGDQVVINYSSGI
ncbi:MAG: SH3 domain-containing protein [Bacteroidota bacterium]